MSAVYRNMDPATVESEYQPSQHVPALQPFIEAYRDRGAAARAAITHHRIAYGDHPDEWLWYVPGARAGSPLLVFLHGGYWRRLSADDGCFLAPAAHELGMAFASVNYTLCPAAPLATLVEQTERAVTFLVGDTAGGGLAGGAGPGHDRGRVHLVGHSAGAHLAAMATVAGHPVAGTVLVSGVFDITPIVHTTINADVGLDHDEALRLSPMFAADHTRAPALRQILAWAEGDTDEFARQSREWADRWCSTAGNRAPVVLSVPGRNHFDVVFDLLDPHTAMGRAVIDQVTTTPPLGTAP